MGKWLEASRGKISADMSSSFRGLNRKSKDALAYLVALFVFLPGILLIVGLVSHVPFALVGGLLTIYYLVALFVVAVKGIDWLEEVLP